MKSQNTGEGFWEAVTMTQVKVPGVYWRVDLKLVGTHSLSGSASYFNCSTIDLLDGRLAVPSVVFTLELGKKMK